MLDTALQGHSASIRFHGGINDRAPDILLTVR